MAVQVAQQQNEKKSPLDTVAQVVGIGSSIANMAGGKKDTYGEDAMQRRMNSMNNSVGAAGDATDSYSSMKFFGRK